MPLPKFPDEATFREQWIRPFLSRMGFAHVHLTHGAGEQGKDFFFADYDRFEHQRFYAAQVKNGNIGSGDTELDSLLFQVKKCFTVKLKHHKDAHERSICATYVMASGKISPTAREYISSWCQRENMGENVYFLDGDTLDRLEKLRIKADDDEAEIKLNGIFQECIFNIEVIKLCRSAIESHRGCLHRTKATSIERLLAEPISSLIPHGLTLEVWELLIRINTICSLHCLAVTVPDETWNTYLTILDNAAESVNKLIACTKLAYDALVNRRTIKVELVC